MVIHTNPDLIILPGDIPSSIDLPILLFAYGKGKSRGEYVKQIYSRFVKRISYRQIRTTKRILSQLSELHIPVLLMHGNTETNLTANWIELYSHRFSNFHWIAGGGYQIDGTIFIGHGYVGVPPKYNRQRSPGEIDQDEDYRHLRFAINRAKIEFPEYDDIVLVSHAPPYNTKVDYLPHKKYHAGSLSVRRVLDEGLVDKVISGHLHEAFGIYKEKNWWAVNAGAVVDDLACTVNVTNGEVYWYRNIIHKPSFTHLLYGGRNRLKYDRQG